MTRNSAVASMFILGTLFVIPLVCRRHRSTMVICKLRYYLGSGVRPLAFTTLVCPLVAVTYVWHWLGIMPRNLETLRP
ncbi:hypothetical protein DFH06DRAFT_1233690 [Mycena polygramma]|nr:hypothetical protein DFH06DRAFT_1233690 [Mycena polygramma]